MPSKRPRPAGRHRRAISARATPTRQSRPTSNPRCPMGRPPERSPMLPGGPASARRCGDREPGAGARCSPTSPTRTVPEEWPRQACRLQRRSPGKPAGAVGPGPADPSRLRGQELRAIRFNRTHLPRTGPGRFRRLWSRRRPRQPPGVARPSMTQRRLVRRLRSRAQGTARARSRPSAQSHRPARHSLRPLFRPRQIRLPPGTGAVPRRSPKR
jgi:hypothetical protein